MSSSEAWPRRCGTGRTYPCFLSEPGPWLGPPDRTGIGARVLPARAKAVTRGGSAHPFPPPTIAVVRARQGRPRGAAFHVTRPQTDPVSLCAIPRALRAILVAFAAEAARSLATVATFAARAAVALELLLHGLLLGGRQHGH